MRNAEARIQADVVAWIRRVLPEMVTFAILNDGLFSKAEAAKRRWMGLQAGMPDVGLVGPDGRAFFFEIKAPGGRLSDEQRDIFERLKMLRAHGAVVRGIDDARRAFAAWGIDVSEQEEEAA